MTEPSPIPPRAPRWALRGAFTVVELLVVVGIVAALLGLLLPATGRAREAAKRVRCASNLRQWGHALVMYVGEHRGFIPREKADPFPDRPWRAAEYNTWAAITAWSGNEELWFNVLPQRYLNDRKGVNDYAGSVEARGEFFSDRGGNVFHCPSASLDRPAYDGPHFSLALNAKLNIDNRRLILSRVRQPSVTPLFLESGFPGEPKIDPRQAAFDGRPHTFANRAAFRHGRRCNFVMADGHVRSFAGPEVVDPATGGAFVPQTTVVWTPDPAMDPN